MGRVPSYKICRYFVSNSEGFIPIFVSAVNSATSFVLSSILTLLIFSGMQMYKPLLVKSPITIIFGGYLGSVMFMFFVTVSFSPATATGAGLFVCDMRLFVCF